MLKEMRIKGSLYPFYAVRLEVQAYAVADCILGGGLLYHYTQASAGDSHKVPQSVWDNHRWSVRCTLTRRTLAEGGIVEESKTLLGLAVLQITGNSHRLLASLQMYAPTKSNHSPAQ